MSNVIDKIKKFQIDRGLDIQEYNALNEHTNIIEELLESIGIDVPKENRSLLKEKIQEFFINQINSNNALNTLTEDVVDAYADVIVFAVGAIMKLGYEPNEVLGETAKEINSRVGSMVDGKFEKDLSEKAKSNWYKANYSKCKIKD